MAALRLFAALTLVSAASSAFAAPTPIAAPKDPIYRLELRKGKSLIAKRDIDSAKPKGGDIFIHQGLNGFAVEIKDDVASCGTFIELGADKSVMVTIVENKSVNSGKINSKMKSQSLATVASKSVRITDAGLGRTCVVRIL